MLALIHADSDILRACLGAAGRDDAGAAGPRLLVRHLLMPGMLAETQAILRFVAAQLGRGTYVNLMAQYRPAGLVGRNRRDGYAEINRRLTCGEYDRAAAFADELGLRRLDERSRASGRQLPDPAGTCPAPGGLHCHAPAWPPTGP